MDQGYIKDLFAPEMVQPRREPRRREEGMTCLHLYPEDLRIPDWELQEDIILVVCRDCGTVLDIGFSSQSGEPPVAPETPPEARLETIY